MNAAAAILELARHEVSVIVRTRRAITIVALYLGLAILGGVIYVLVVHFGEEKALETLRGQGMEESAAVESMRTAAAEGYRKLAVWFAGVEDPSEVAATLRDSVILPVFFWCSLALLPFVILLTSFDQLSADLDTRSICYTILRARRSEIVLGKALAHTLVLALLTAVGSTVLVLVASLLLATVDFGGALLGLLRMWLLLIPFGLCYLGIASYCSASNTQPVPALVSAVALTIALRVIGWFGYVPDDSSWAWLKLARWLSPATYQDGLWLAGFTGPALSAAAYVGFAALFTVLSTLRLRARDL